MIKLILFILFPFLCFASLNDVDRQEVVFKNLLDSSKNGGFESGHSGWSASGGDTYAIATSGTELLVGKASATWDSAGADRILESPFAAIPKGYYGKQGLAQCLIKVPSGTATHKLSVWDGSAYVATLDPITSSATPTFSQINFTFPTSGQLSLRLRSVASNEPSITVDECYIGLASNLTNVSQAQYYGGTKVFGNTNCQWGRNSAGSEGTFSADSDCNAPTNYGNASTSTKIPGALFATLPAGHYQVVATFSADMASNVDCRWGIYDGTTVSGYFTDSPSGAGVVNLKTLTADYDYTSTQNSITFQLYARHVSGSPGCQVPANSSIQDFAIHVYKYPSTTNIIYTPEVSNWRLDSYISGADIDIGTSDISTFTSPTDGGLTLTLNSGSIPAKITCSSTNAPSGTTCAAGTEQMGVNFDIPAAQDVEICGSFSHAAFSSAAKALYANWTWVETASNSQTVVQDCGPNLADGKDNSVADNPIIPVRLCGVCHFASAGNKTLRIMEKQSIDASFGTNKVWATTHTNASPTVTITARPLTQNVPAPVLIGQVPSVRYYANTSTANNFPHNTVKIIDYNVMQWETGLTNGDSVTTGASWKYTSAHGGEYEVSPSLEIDLNPSVGANLAVNVNGTTECYGLFAQNASQRMSCKVKVNAGDYIQAVEFQRNGGSTTANINDFGTTNNRQANYIEIKKIN